MDSRTTATQTTVDPRATEEAQNLANTAIYLRICAENIMDLQDKLQELQAYFNRYTEEPDAVRMNLKRGIAVAGAAAILVYGILWLVYHASSSCSRELSTSNGMWFDSFAIMATLYAWSYADTKPGDRPFKWNENITRFMHDDFKTIEAGLEDFLVSLRQLSKNLHTTYGDANPSLQLVYFDLEKEIDVLKDKDNLTINKAREELDKVARIVAQTRAVVENTRPHPQGLFTPKPGSRIRAPMHPTRPVRELDLRIDDDTYMKGLRMV